MEEDVTAAAAHQPAFTEALAPWEDGQRVPIRPDTFEWWYFDTIMDDGSTCVVNFLTKADTGKIGPLTPSIQFNISRPDGTYLQFLHSYPVDTYSASTDHCNVHIGPNWVHGTGHDYNLYAEGDGMEADLTLSDLVPGWRFGPALTPEQATAQSLGWQPIIPSGTVRGTLTYDGQEHQVLGTCYHDHQWGHISPNSTSTPYDYWYWGRAHVDDYSTVFAEIVPKPGTNAELQRVFMLARGSRILTVNPKPLTVSAVQDRTASNGTRYPGHVELDWQSDNKSVRIRLTNPAIIANFGKYLRFLSDIEMRIDDGETKSTGSAKAIWEVLHLS